MTSRPTTKLTHCGLVERHLKESTTGLTIFYHRSMPLDPDQAIEALYGSDWGRIVATLIRMAGDFEVAEEAVQEAFAAAVGQWRSAGVPQFPRAWIIQTARHKAIDRIRHRARSEEKLEMLVTTGMVPVVEEPDYDTGEIPDDRLRLIFTCCHPALAM